MRAARDWSHRLRGHPGGTKFPKRGRANVIKRSALYWRGLVGVCSDKQSRQSTAGLNKWLTQSIEGSYKMKWTQNTPPHSVCRRAVSLLRKSSDIFLTSKALIKKGVPDANDAPTTAVSSENSFTPFILNQNVSSVRFQPPRGKTKCVKIFLLITHLDQYKGKTGFVPMCWTIYISSNHNQFSKT